MTPASREYLKAPDDIYAESFRIAQAETDLSGIDEEMHPLALRLVHAVGDPTIVRHLTAVPGAVVRGAAALGRGAPIITDSEMLVAGVIRQCLPRNNKVLC